MKSSMLILAAALAAGIMGSTAKADSYFDNAYYAVNSGNSFYVGSTSVIQTFGQAVHIDATDDVVMATNAGGYADAGIVLAFDGSLKLGDFNTLSVSSEAHALSVNLWLDTGSSNVGNNSAFFAFNGAFPGTRTMTGLAGDSYGGHDGTSIDGSSSFYMLGGDGAGGTFTLDQLKSGAVPGINANTPVALWIGLVGDGTGGAIIHDATINADPVPLPAAAWSGLALLGGCGLLARVKRLRRQPA